jgi:pyridoxal phosphate enzyme (YggS family)
MEEPFPAERLAMVRARIAAAAVRVGRDQSSVRLIGASKTVPAEVLAQAVRAGLQDLGENRVQEAEAKAPLLRADLTDGAGPKWHLIGHLQSNTARKAVALFDWIHSVDSPRLADALDRIALELGRTPRVLIEVNTSGEVSKEGVAPADAPALIAHVAGLSAIRLVGLMTIGPLAGDARPAFRLLKQLRDAAGLPELVELSMGMSGDFEDAVEEGATMVRVGSALFGARTL